MTISRFLLMLALVAVFAAGTTTAGWLAVPAIAVVAGALYPSDRRRPRRERAGNIVALSAGVAWALLVALGAARGPLWAFAGRLGAVLGVPAAALVLITVAFAALLAWSAATLGAAAAHSLPAPLARVVRRG